MPSPVTEGLDLGHVREGVVEIDPMTGRMVIRTDKPDGTCDYLDVQEALTKYEGQDVRVVIVPQATINRVAQLVDEGNLQGTDIPRAGRN
jgi:hypothetical protein